MRRDEVILGRFELRERLGPSSAWTQTWRTDQGVLKLAEGDSQAGADIRGEATLLAAIPADEARAAQIAPMLAHGSDDRWSWLLLEDVGELDLSRHWAREGVDFASVMDVGQAVARALACLHAHGVLHRDVKEANIVVAPGRGPGRYWLVDLGIGRRLDHRPAVTMDLRGSHDRVPPEAVTAGRKVGPPGDVFVLCKLLAQGLVGSPNVPWPDDVDAQLRACSLDPDDPRHLALVRLLARGMRLEPDGRPSAAELAEAFEAIRAGKVGASRSRWWLPLATFVAGGAIVGAVLLWPEAQLPPGIAFEDKSVEWNVQVAAPDVASKAEGAAPSSGFFGHPSAVDFDGDGQHEVLLPRQGRVWETTSEPHLRDLVLRWSGERFDWSIDTRPGAAHQVFAWYHDDLDGDGIRDRVGLDHDESWMYRTLLQRSGDAFAPTFLSSRFPFLVPTTRGTRQLGTTGWLDGQTGDEARRWTRAAIGAQPTGWMDLEADGQAELLAQHADRPTLFRWVAGRWQGESLLDFAPWQHGTPPGGTVLPADMDADGDEDLIIGVKEGARLVFMEARASELVQVRGAELPVLDEGEAIRETYGATLAVDLDADGLRDIVLCSGGFPDKGHATSKVFRNLGDWRFERVVLPAELALAHDGTGAVVLDADGDGRLDLLHFSLNDRERACPTHRAWRGTGEGPHRSWPLQVTAPGGAGLPLGTRLEATEPSAWLHVVRDAGPIYVPSWLKGQLLVVLPTGRIGAIDLERGLVGPASRKLELEGGPTLYTPGGVAVEPGRAVEVTGSPSFHALQPGWELLLDREPRPGSLHLWHDGEHAFEDIPLYDEGLGCLEPHGCIVQLRAPGGGYTPARLDPRTGAIEQLAAPGDMSVGHVVGHGRAWTSSGGQVWERNPETYAEIPAPSEPEPKIACESLGFDGTDLACSSSEPPRLVIYDPDSLKARLVVELPGEGGSSLLPTPAGWVVSLQDGLAWVNRQGSMRIVHLEGTPLLGATDELAWAVLEHRVLWLDLAAERIRGGLGARGVGRALPVPMGGQLGYH